MTRAILSLSVCVALAACSNDKSTLDELELFKNKICECKDRACIDAAENSSHGLEQKLDKLSEEELTKSLEIATDIAKCTAAL